MNRLVDGNKAQLAQRLGELARGEGYSASRLPGVKFMRSTKVVPCMKVAYEPSIVIVAQGKKRGLLDGQVFEYDADHYLTLSVPLPFECDTEGTEDEPMLGVSVGVTPALVGELMMEMEMGSLTPVTDRGRLGIHANPMDEVLRGVVLRLVESLRSAQEAKILGPLLVKELVYRVLCREEGGTLRALATPHSHFGQISRVLQRMHVDYARPMEMADLAAEAGMSVSNFHNHFKAITSSPPLQYLKSVRLHRARLLMVHEGLNAGNAAREVGYESVSQFSREFKRFFGGTPVAVAEELRMSFMSLE
ncbi:AraC family transcriptional regulator [Phragmitibacter flavus]|uniref:AraC family transcriptional regulator n=1 Tax=Phragmitibacter flavus TaxID=2576071 RepID=A0A5R8KG39_9BACT|nr:AraC family transcriptional regulator [Phragmitibacter flavus]TLD71253.1 AraC family transcriptional regulator [Phragmitibacter flavus]